MFSRNDQDFFVWGLDDSGKTTRFVRREWGLGWAYKAGNEGLKKIWEEELQDLYPSIHPWINWILYIQVVLLVNRFI